MALNEKQIKYLKDYLNSERERLLNSFQVDEEKFQLQSEDRMDEVDQASAEYERSQMLRFRNRDLFYAKKLLGALEKIEQGEYGVCEECGEDIRFERLKARPTAELCIACKDDAERAESNNFQAKQSKSLGKQISLAKDTTL
ncbi:MAG: TraR/DksA family transcriptional regulator [Bacteriovoracaceae bacterium]